MLPVFEGAPAEKVDLLHRVKKKKLPDVIMAQALVQKCRRADGC